MSYTSKVFAGALLVGASAWIGAAPASADVGVSIGIGVPGVQVWSGPYYDYYRPCSYYRYYDIPAPGRCYRYLGDYWGPHIYVDGDFIFRDRDDWWRWHDRAEYRHWRNHEWKWRAGPPPGHEWDRGHGRDWNPGHDHDDWDRGHGHGDHDHGDHGHGNHDHD